MLVVWWPVVVMLLVIARESTAMFSAANTGPLLRGVWQTMFGAVTDARWEEIHHLLRKTGHFVGYGLLGISWLRVWLLMWRLPLRSVRPGVRRGYAFVMAISCTTAVACLDEFHQTYLPSRTGLASDVLLDTLGALVICGIVAAGWFWLPASA